MSSLTTLQQLQPQVFDGIQVEIPSSEAGQIQTRYNIIIYIIMDKDLYHVNF